MRLAILLLGLAIGLLTLGCSMIGDEADIRKLLEAQIGYLNARDVDGYMSTIASEAQGRPGTEMMMRQLAGYSLRYEIEDVKILNVQNGRGVARVIQTTRVTGPRPKLFFGLVDVQDNRSTFEHTVVKESRGWKVQSSTIVNVEQLAGGNR